MEGPIRVPGREVVPEQPPLGYPAAACAMAACTAQIARLCWRRRMRLPSRRLGTRMRFADGTGRCWLRTTPGPLCRVLALVSVRGSVHYVVLLGLRRDLLLDSPDVLQGTATGGAAWWRLVAVG